MNTTSPRTLAPESTIMAGFGLAFAVLITVGLVQHHSVRILADQDSWVARTRQIDSELEAVCAAILQGESGTRGYVITGEQDYLGQQQGGIDRTRGHLRTVRPLIADPRQARSFETLSSMAERKIAMMHFQAGLRRDQGFPAASRFTESEEPLILMNQIRAQVDEMEGREAVLLEQRQAASREDARKSAAAIALGTALALGIVLAAAWVSRRDLRRRQQAEQALGSERQRLLSLFEALPPMICLLDRDHRITFANRAFRDKFGEPEGRNCYQQVFGASAPCDFCQAYTVLETGQSRRWECATPDGGVIDVCNVPFTDVDGSPMILEMNIDVTGQRRAEEHRARLAAIVDSSDDAIIGKTLDGVIESWNRGAERLYGYAADEMMGRSISILLPPDRRDELDVLLERLGRGESLNHYETVRLKKDGLLVDVSLTLSPIRNAAGRIIGASSVARDITERKRAEEALRRSEVELKEAQRVGRLGNWSLDFETGQACYSEELYRILGLPPSSPLPPFNEQSRFFTPETWAALNARVAQCRQDGMPYEIETETVSVDGTHGWQIARGEPVLDAQGAVTGLRGVTMDITERKQAEAALNERERVQRLILDHSPMGVLLTTGIEQTIVYENPRFVQLFGYPVEKVSRANEWWPLAYPEPEYREWVSAEWNRRIAKAAGTDGEIEPMEVEITCADGTKKSMSVGAKLIGEINFVTFIDLTERKRAEEIRSRLAAIVESSAVAIESVSLDGIITSWNPGAERLYGFTAEEAIGRPVSIIAPPELAGDVERTLRQIAGKEEVRQVETLRLRNDGSRVSVAATISPVKDALGRVVGASSVSFDITERRRAEEALRQAGAYNRTLIEASLDPLVTISPDGKVTDVNAATEKVTGLSREDLIGTDFCDYFTDPERARAGYQQVFREGSVQDYEMELRHREGHTTPVVYNASLYRDEGGEVVGVFAAARDITERKRAAEKLAAERQRFNNILDVMPAYTVLLTPDYHVPFANRFFEERFGKSFGKRCFEYLFGRTEPCEICHSFEPFKTNKPVNWFWTGPDGRDYDIYDFPFTDSDGSRLVLEMGIDITERNRAEREVRELNATLERRVAGRTAELAAINQELEAFTYSVAHDLRAPLRGMDGFSQALLEDYLPKLDREGQTYIQRIRAAALRMSELIEDLLNLSRISRAEVHKERVDLTGLAVEAATELRKSAPERQAEFLIPPGLAAQGDPHLLRIVIDNLLANAWKFSARRSPARIEIGITARNNRPVYFIRDNGVGFDMAYAGKLFAPFQRVHSAAEFPGTGIGLVTVARIVHKHGGEVWAEAEVEKGATFYFTLGEEDRQFTVDS